MSARRNAPMWVVVSVAFALFVILAALQLLGFVAFTPTVASIMYLLAIFSVMIMISHAAGLIL